MSRIEEILLKDYEEAKKRTSEVSVNTDEYEIELRNLDNIRNEIIAYKKVEKETDMKYEQIIRDSELRESQIELENRRENKRIWVNAALGVGSFLLSVYGLNKTFKFDKESTPTSTLGVPILREFVPKFFKRQ